MEDDQAVGDVGEDVVKEWWIYLTLLVDHMVGGGVVGGWPNLPLT